MIQANFNAYASYITDSLWQWDLNQTLELRGLNLSSAPEVHFSNANMDRAIVRQATNVDQVVRVEIPNSLLQDPLTIQAHVGIYEGKTFKVIEKVVIPVNPRKRPFDYQIQDSDEEIYSFKELENKLNNVLDEIATTYSSINTALISLEDSGYNVKIMSHTLKANKWATDLYILEDVYPIDKYRIEVSVDAMASEAQYDAFHAAKIVGSASRNMLKACAGQPNVDIPVILKVYTIL